jgi:hypothetical protein
LETLGQRAAREAAISERAREFDLLPLLSRLRELGYGPEQLLFESNPEQHAAGTLVEAVRFERGRAGRTVRIVLNLGLLGPDPLVPSYFLELAEALPEPERFHDFLRFFDAHLLWRFVEALHPELDPAMYRDFGALKRTHLAMLGVGSRSTLHWLFALYLPELRVRVTRRSFKTSTRSHRLRIDGEVRLDGTGVLGRMYDAGASGFLVELEVDEELDARGRAWAQVVRERLARHLLPVLAPFGLELSVVLIVREPTSWAKLAPAGSLGYERLRGPAEGGHRIVVHQSRGPADVSAPDGEGAR